MENSGIQPRNCTNLTCGFIYDQVMLELTAMNSKLKRKGSVPKPIMRGYRLLFKKPNLVNLRLLVCTICTLYIRLNTIGNLVCLSKPNIKRRNKYIKTSDQCDCCSKKICINPYNIIHNLKTSQTYP